MKTRSSIFLVMISLSFLICFSCSKDEPAPEVQTLEEKLEGKWVGIFPQDSYGSIKITLIFSELKVNKVSGSWTTVDHDLSSCDSDIWVCDSFECKGTLSYDKTNGQTIVLDVKTDSGPCWEESFSEIKFLDDNTIDYTNIVPGESMLNGTMERQ